MKTQSPALAAHTQGGTTTLAYCWKVTRTDGATFHFTSCDVPLLFEGDLYEAATGFTPSAIASKADLSVVNLEVAGMLSSDSITEDDLLAGRWDGAQVEIFEVNYKDLTQGRRIMGGGKIGDVTAGKVAFQAELRGLTQALQQPFGQVYDAACNAILGDARCGVDLPALEVAGTVTSASSLRSFGTALAQADDYFGGGVVAWLTGLNAGLRMEVQTFAAGAFVLVLPMPYVIAAGDTFTVVPGCRKRFTEDCVGKFSNAVNFRGFPHIPGNNRVLGDAGLDAA